MGNPTATTRKTPFHLMFESTGFDCDLYQYMFCQMLVLTVNWCFRTEMIFKPCTK